MGVLAMQAFLVSVDHCFPVESAFVFDAAAIGEFGEVYFL